MMGVTNLIRLHLLSHTSQLLSDFVFTGDMRSRWKSVVRDLSLILLGLLAGLCIAQYVSLSIPVGCSSSSIKRTHQQREEANTESNTESTSIESSETNTVTTDQLSKSNVIRTFNNQIDKNLKRPKYLRHELQIRQPLYIGVVTATEFLDTRARDVNNTWGKKAPKIEYFASESHSSHSLPVVSLPGVDDTYPPQKKVYRMLRYMHDHYINKYNWFMRADDDIYVRIPELLKFLSKLDPSEDLYIGSPGFGRDNDLERIKLYPHERYCMGGPGVIFSRALLIKLVPHLEDCLENVVVSWNEDLEVGRCISRKLNVQCTWAYEMRKLFYMDYSKGVMFKDAGIYRDKIFTSVITAHPFKSTEMMHRVHQFFLEIKLRNLDKERQEIKEELQLTQKKNKKLKAFP